MTNVERKSRKSAMRPAAVLAILAALMMSLALAACGGGGSSSSSSDSTTASSGSGSSASSAATTASDSSASTQGVTVNLGILQGATLAAVAKHIGSLEEELAKDGAKVAYQ